MRFGEQDALYYYTFSTFCARNALRPTTQGADNSYSNSSVLKSALTTATFSRRREAPAQDRAQVKGK